MSPKARAIVNSYHTGLTEEYRVLPGRLYGFYPSCLPSDYISNFMLLMLREFPGQFLFVLDMHEDIHTMLEEEGHQCGFVKAILTSAGLHEIYADKFIQDGIHFCRLINSHHFVMDIPPDATIWSYDIHPIDFFSYFFEDFLEALVDIVIKRNSEIVPIYKKLLNEYYQAKKKLNDVPKIAAQNRFRLEKRQNDLQIKFDTITERNQKRRARIEYLTKLHQKQLSEGENVKVKAQSSNVQKKSLNDFVAKTSEKEADMEKMNTLLSALKQQLSDVKEKGMKQQEARNREREAKKAKIKELNSTLDDLNEKIQQKESSIVVLRKKRQQLPRT